MTAVYPGSFDPVTLGHMDVIARAARVVDKLIVAVMVNPNKQPMFTAEERVALLVESTRGMENVRVAAHSGLLADFAAAEGAGLVIKAVRNAADFEYEQQMAYANDIFAGGLETVLLCANPALSYISSGLVRETAALIYAGNRGDAAIDGMAQGHVKQALKQKCGIKTHKEDVNGVLAGLS